MKNKAFTLTELLGVIVILGILALVTFPNIASHIGKAKKELKEGTKILIIDAAKDYYEDNKNDYDQLEGMTYCIDIDTLTNNNYLNKKIKDENLNDIDTSKKVKMLYQNEKFNYEVVDSCTYYTVTFDANGGSVDIDSKEVIENSIYGTLPTPTRSGYTFMGWNGKNMFDYDSAIYGYATSKLSLNGEKIYKRQSSYRPSVSIWPVFYTSTEYINFVEDNKYTISFDIWADYEVNFTRTRQFFINNSVQPVPTHNLSNIKTSKQKLYASFIYKDGTNPILHIYPIVTSENGIDTDNNYYISNIQVEPGDTATEYEPYFVTSKTKVTRNYDHTLKAIWKENE